MIIASVSLLRHQRGIPSGDGHIDPVDQSEDTPKKNTVFSITLV